MSDAAASGETAARNGNGEYLLRVRNLTKHFERSKGLFRKVVATVRAVDDVSFGIRRGETLSLVGESGSGKTTTGRCILRAIEPTSGEIAFHMAASSQPVDMRALDRSRLKSIRKGMSLICQDPYSSLNPRMNILETVGEPLIVHGEVTTRKELEERVAELLSMVRLNPDYMSRYPHAFSGGQRQRIAIARALALQPEFIVADESVSALDVSVQAQILNLMGDLQDSFHLTYLFIAHNLAVVEYVSDRIAVMYVGKVVEMAGTVDLFSRPLHPYTEALLSAVPKADPRLEKDRIVLQGDIADPAHPPSGCYFHPRCRYAQDVCAKEQPPLREIEGMGSGHRLSACHFSESLALRGVEQL